MYLLICRRLAHKDFIKSTRYVFLAVRPCSCYHAFVPPNGVSVASNVLFWTTFRALPCLEGCGEDQWWIGWLEASGLRCVRQSLGPVTPSAA